MEIKQLFGPDVTQAFLDVLATLAPINLTPQAVREVFLRRLTDGWITVIAVDADEVIGTASMLMELKFTRGNGDGGRVAHVEDVVIRSDRQRCGIGAALIADLVGRAREAGCYKVTLACADSNVAFYEKSGFRQHGTEMRLDL